ncbi:tudor domain-containing protein 5 isoform X2 [Elgaria multicarinata webbii]|uniref:tudor domain-containing protein 5 isoform X2 n=1 Tax=Elgaria multicarinata webbii TaxID=159646 RepID=UPI002FCD0901
MSDQEHLMNLLKKEVRSLLTSIQEGLTPFQLEEEYKSMIGEQLPFRALGYRSIMELVKDMPDVVNVCPKGNGDVILKAIADESTKGIASLVARQKKNRPKPQPSRHRLNFSYSTSWSGLPWRPKISVSLPRRGRVLPTLPAVVKSELKELLSCSPVLLSDFDKAFIKRFGRTFEFIRYGFFSMFEVLDAASDIITIMQTRAGSLLTLKKNPSLKKPPEKLPESPAVKTPPLTPVLPVDNQSLTPRQESDTSLVQLKQVETPLVRSDERMKQLEKEMKIALAQKGPGGTVSLELKEKIKTIVAQHPDGLLASKLPVEFEVHFKETLPIRKLGFLNLMDLVGALSDVLHIECKEREQDWLIFHIDSQCLTGDEQANDKIGQSLAHEGTPSATDLSSWDFPLEDSKKLETKFNVVTKMMAPHLDMEEPHIMQEILEDEIPPDAVLDRSLYSLPQRGSSALVGVLVEYIVSPSQFYVRIDSAETSNKLEDMMVEMRRCYSSKNVADRYIIPEASIRPGHLCCVRNLEDKWWYRVIIHQALNDQEVEVFYPDFGNMGIVQKNSLRFLKYCYAKLPAQAIPCSLAWVKPTEGDWTVNAVLKFRRLCELKLLVGVVDEYIDGVLHLFLCDTSSDEDIYLHNILRLEGHALICRENIPSKGFRELNPSTVYIKSSPKEQASLTESDASLIQQESFGDLPEITDSERCKNEVVLQRFDKREDLAHLEPEQLEQGDKCFADSSYCSYDFQEKGLFRDCHGNSSLEQNEQMLEAKDTTSLCSEMPYLEPVYLCKEIWDENWIPSKYCEEKENGKICENLCSDTAAFSCQASTDKGSKDEAHHSQDLMQQDMDISNAVDRTKNINLEPLSKILGSSGGMETNSLGATSGPLSQTQEEFYISISHLKKSGELSQIDLDVNKLSSDNSQPLPSASASQEEAPSEKKVDNASRTKAVALCSTRICLDQGNISHNTLMFTAELQGSPKFCVPCSPTVALGASARLAMSGGYFSLSLLRKIKT